MGTARIWLHGFVAAVVSGGATAGVAAFADPNHFKTGIEWESLLSIFLAGAALGALMYLKQSPIPASKIETKVETIKTETVTPKD